MDGNNKNALRENGKKNLSECCVGRFKVDSQSELLLIGVDNHREDD